MQCVIRDVGAAFKPEVFEIVCKRNFITVGDGQPVLFGFNGIEVFGKGCVLPNGGSKREEIALQVVRAVLIGGDAVKISFIRGHFFEDWGKCGCDGQCRVICQYQLIKGEVLPKVGDAPFV